MRSRLAVLVLLLFALPAVANAHRGRLDSLGCHNNRKLGGYHCHRGPLAGQSFASKAEALQALGTTQAGESQQAAQSKAQKQGQDDREERTVYITRTGKKYHGPNCSYLRRSKIPISLKEARAQGYTACSRCGGR